MVYQPLPYLQVLIAGDLFSNILYRFSDFMKAAICVLWIPGQWIEKDFEVYHSTCFHTQRGIPIPELTSIASTRKHWHYRKWKKENIFNSNESMRVHAAIEVESRRNFSSKYSLPNSSHFSIRDKDSNVTTYLITFINNANKTHCKQPTNMWQEFFFKFDEWILFELEINNYSLSHYTRYGERAFDGREKK